MSLSTEIGRCNAGIHCSTLMRLENGYNSNDFKVNRVANSEPQTSTHGKGFIDIVDLCATEQRSNHEIQYYDGCVRETLECVHRTATVTAH